MSGPLVLAIDTTTEFGSLALARDGNVIAQVLLESPDGYGHVVFERIEALLTANGVTLHDIDVFAAAAGPGTFTGVRVGLTAAKGFASALGKRAAGVSNLQALALLGAGEQRAAVLDARRGEVYAGLFDAVANPIGPEVVAPLGAWIETLPPGETTFIFTDAAPFAAALTEDATRVSAGHALAGAIALLAPAQAKDPALLDANYVRKSDAEMAWQDR
jgi:tRNA threonylcarbamoyladenosine biosynthesis protein TsaB